MAGTRALGLNPGCPSARWWPWASWFTSCRGTRGAEARPCPQKSRPRPPKEGREAALGTVRDLQLGLRPPVGLPPARTWLMDRTPVRASGLVPAVLQLVASGSRVSSAPPPRSADDED